MPSEDIQITKFQDSNINESEEVKATISPKLANMVNTYPSQTPVNILTRNYKIAEIPWGPGIPTTTVLNFPRDFITLPNIQKRLTGFAWMRAGVRLEVKLNATSFHYGAFLISWLPNHTTTDHNANIYQQSANNPLVLSPSIQNSCTFEIPWINPYNFFPIADPQSDIARVCFTPITPLTRTTPDVSDTAYIQVFASFIDPEVAGYIAQSSTMMKKESIDKSRLQITDIVPTEISTVMEKIPIIGDMISTFSSLLTALDKPTSVASTMPVSLSFSRDLSHGTGLDYSTSLSLKQLAPINLDQSLMGTNTNVMSIHDIISTPMIYDITTLSNTSLPLNFLIVPNATPSDYLGFMSRFFKYWRGSIKYQLNFYTSSFITGRFRVSVLYNSTIPTDDNAGDVVSRIIDVKGDTSVSFTVPYLWDTTYRRLNDTNYPTLHIQRVTPIIGQSLATDAKIHLVTWRSAGEDFAFNQMVDHYASFDDLQDDSDPWVDVLSTSDEEAEAQTNPRADFKRVFEPIIQGSCFIREKGAITGEVIESVHDMSKRYVSGVDYSANTIFTTPNQIYNGAFHKLGSIFKYFRGARRVKVIPKEDPNVLQTIFMENPGDTYDASNGMAFTMSTHWPLLEVEIPWYSAVPFWPIDEASANHLRLPDKPRTIQTAGFDPSSAIHMFISGGDDFTYGFLVPPP